MAHSIASAKFRIYFGDEIAIGPGKAALLVAIREHGSISAAAKSLRMSYKRAWNLVDTMNRCFKSPLISTATGGGGGGGARITHFGEQVLSHYASMQKRTDIAIQRDLAAFAALLSDKLFS